MKKLIVNSLFLSKIIFYMKALAFLLFLLPVAAVAQTNKNIENAMTKFQRFYNAGQGDSINNMFGRSWDQMKNFKAMWTRESNAALLEEFGKLEKLQFIGIDRSDPQKVYVFQTIFSKGGEKTTSLTLDKDNKLSTFRFITSSGQITRLLKKYHQINGR